MSIYLKLAIRNLFRNKRRTFIAGTAIGIGLAALIFTDALLIGMEENMVASATESFMGDGQIHGEGYREQRDVEMVVADLSEVIERLEKDEQVRHYSKRVLAVSMISSPANVAAVELVGIDPTHERHLSQIDEAMINGEYLDTTKQRQLILGSKLAEILEVELGERLVVTVSQAHSGELSQEMFRLTGIYHFNVEEMDRGMAFVLLGKAQEMLGLDNDVHEVALDLYDNGIGRDKSHPLWQQYSQGKNEAVGWVVLLPELKMAFEMSQFTTAILGLILFGVVSFGIINTLFMSLHERMFEFGVLRAVGTRPLAMARLVLLEAVALGTLSVIIGAIMGFALTYILGFIGIDYRGIEFSGVTFRELLFPVLTVDQFIIYPLAVFFFTGLVGLFPAIVAARLQPAEAMRRSF